MLRSFVATGEVVARNPAIAGGTTAFLVSLCFVSANALWYQPHFYDGAFFATRQAQQAAAVPPKAAPAAHVTPRPSERPEPAPDESATTGAIVRSMAAGDTPGDPKIWGVQKTLADLGLYKGSVDGLSGPQTSEAISNYQRIVGIDVSGNVDDALLRHLGIDAKLPANAEAPPQPAPRPGASAAVVASAEPDAPAASSSRTRKIQAGLKAFGNDGIEIDGMAGADTHAAIREFQSLFGLEVTGEPNEKVLAKMKAIGLVN